VLFLFTLIFYLGPQAVGQGFDWEWMNPLPGGNALRGAVRLDSTNALLLGFMNEIFRTSDQGESWQKQFRNIDALNVIQNAVRMDDGSLLCVAGHSLPGPQYGDYEGIYRSDDQGETWDLLESRKTTSGAMLAANGSIAIYRLGELEELRLSTDRGRQWTQIPPLGVVTASVISESCVIAVRLNNGSILISADSARTWIESDHIADRWVQPIAWDDSTLFCAVQDSSFAALTKEGALLFYEKIGSRIRSVVRMGTALIACGDAGMLRSTDGGLSWTAAELQPPAESWGNITVFDAAHAIVGAKRTSRTSDGGHTWREAETNHSFYIQRIASTPSSKCVGVTSSGEIVTSADRGVHWSVQQREIGRVSDLCVVNDRVIIVSADTTAILRSSDEGESWQWIRLGQEDPVIALERLSDRIVIALTRRGLMTSFDAGVSWAEVYFPDSVRNMGFRDVSFAAGRIGVICTSGNRQLLTTNAGITWSTIATPEHANMLSVKVMESGDLLLVGRDSFSAISGIYHSSDAGATWKCTFAFGYENYLAKRIWSIVALDAQHALAVGSEGVILWTEDGGKKWIRQAFLTPAAWYDAAFVSKDIAIVAGPYEAMLRGQRNIPSAINESHAAASRHSILSCYPQPAIGTVTAVVQVREDEEIQFRITDMLGRVIAAHSPAFCSRGERSFSLPLHDVQSGVYFLQLVSSEGVDTKPIVVLR
jgi:photosystem II stability/assembly factor-like uncharacterized protein